jgi:membrane protease YdiL (CAAX protease family)
MSNDSSSRKRKILRHRDNRPGNFGHPLYVIATTFLIFIITQLVAAILVESVFAVLHSGYDISGSIDKSAPAQFFYILLAEAGAVWLVLKILKSRGLSRSKIGLGRKPVATDLIKGLLGFAAFFAILAVVNIALSSIFPDLNKEQQDVGFNTLNTALDWVLALFSLVILPPIGEEILVRGYLYSGLRSRMTYVKAMLITSVMFGLAHLQLGSGTGVVWAAGVDTFMLSLILVYLRDSTGALYAGMLVHALNNLIAFGVHFH